MAAQSPSHRAFLKHLEALGVATTDPQGLATQLYEDGLIDRLALQRAGPDEGTQLERSRALLQTLDAKLQTDEGVFDEFLCILGRDPTMVEMCRKLRDTLRGKHYYYYTTIKGNVAVYKDLNIEFVTKKSFCHENAV